MALCMNDSNTKKDCMQNEVREELKAAGYISSDQATAKEVEYSGGMPCWPMTMHSLYFVCVGPRLMCCLKACCLADKVCIAHMLWAHDSVISSAHVVVLQIWESSQCWRLFSKRPSAATPQLLMAPSGTARKVAAAMPAQYMGIAA